MIVAIETLIVSIAILTVSKQMLVHPAIRCGISLFMKRAITRVGHKGRSNEITFHRKPFIKENERVVKDKEVHQERVTERPTTIGTAKNWLIFLQFIRLGDLLCSSDEEPKRNQPSR
jgi:hypothetical protein